MIRGTKVRYFATAKIYTSNNDGLDQETAVEVARCDQTELGGLWR